jgi:hypothetical protein
VPIAALANEPFIVTHFQEGVGFHAHVAAMCREGQLTPRIAQRARQFAAITSLVTVRIQERARTRARV